MDLTKICKQRNITLKFNSITLFRMKSIALLLGLVISLLFCSYSTMETKVNSKLNPPLNQYIENAKKDFDKIPADRKAQLKK